MFLLDKKDRTDLELQLIPKMPLNNTQFQNRKSLNRISESNGKPNLRLSLMDKNPSKEQSLFSEHQSEELDVIRSVKNDEHLGQQFIKQFTFLVNTSPEQMNTCSIIEANDPNRLYYTQLFDDVKNKPKKRGQVDAEYLGLDYRQSRLVAVMVGLGIGDALGSSTQFARYKINGYGIFRNKNIQGFQATQKAVKDKVIYPNFQKNVNEWTDDTSMALCLAYSLIYPPKGFKPNYMRKLYHLWWEKGLCNGGLPDSIGLGGNISKSFEQFKLNSKPRYVKKADQNNNGNGSLMRLAPAPLFYNLNVDKAMKIASLQSRTTHNGFQASQCCRLLTLIILNLVNRQENNLNWKTIIQQTGFKFISESKQVQCLAKGLKQPQELFDKNCLADPNYQEYNWNLNDRNWNWKDEKFDYSPTRLNMDSAYIGSYCMDGLAMALHIVWTTKSFRECVQKAADMGGDADTVGAIAGQIAGAIYGFDKDMFQLYSEMADFKSSRYELFLVGLRLINFQHKTSCKKLYDFIINIPNCIYSNCCCCRIPDEEGEISYQG